MPVNNQLAEIPTGEATGAFTYDRLVGLLNYLVEQALFLGGLVAMIAIIFYGLQIAFSKGDSAKLKSARESLTKAIIGAVIIAGVYTIIYTVQGAADTLTD